VWSLMSEEEVAGNKVCAKRGIEMDKKRVAAELVRLAKGVSSDRKRTAVDVEKHIKTIQRMTDSNRFSESLLYLFAKVLRDREAASAMRAVIALRDYFGSMPAGLRKVVYDKFYKKGIEQVRREFDEETAERIYMAF